MPVPSRRPVSPRHATAADAVRYLASVCDGAVRRDGHGFGSDHASYGHWLAALPLERWTPTEHAAARQLVGIYRNQLARAGFAPADILSGRRPRRLSRRASSQLRGGWALDPSGLHEWRWWSGLRWTEHVSPGPTAADTDVNESQVVRRTPDHPDATGILSLWPSTRSPLI